MMAVSSLASLRSAEILAAGINPMSDRSSNQNEHSSAPSSTVVTFATMSARDFARQTAR